MEKKFNVNPIGLKGNQINERMKELMGIKPINETKTNYVIELTKAGADGNAYAIVRENHEWYIKKANKIDNLIAEDFKYIGGLQNKKDEAYSSYNKAVKHLTLKLKSLAETYNYEGDINIFKNDNLLKESGHATFSEMKGNGFAGYGNLEGHKSMDEMYMDEAKKKNPWAICTAKVGREDKDKYESCVMGVKKSVGMDENMTEEAWMKECGYMEEEVEMTEYEKAIDEMIASEELHGGQKKLDLNKNGRLDADDFKMLRTGKKKLDEYTEEDNYINSLREQIKTLFEEQGRAIEMEDFEKALAIESKIERLEDRLSFLLSNKVENSNLQESRLKKKVQ